MTNAQIGKFVREETFWLRANLILFNLMAGWVNYGKWWFGGLGVFERKLNYTTSKTILLFTLPSLTPISKWSGNHFCLLFHNKTIITIMIIRIMIILVTIIGMSIWLGKAFLCAKIQSQKIYYFPLTSQLSSHILLEIVQKLFMIFIAKSLWIFGSNRDFYGGSCIIKVATFPYKAFLFILRVFSLWVA